MSIASIGCVLLVLLIGYWWANQGLFSAVLHLLCVIVAGALAFSFWEPAATMMLRGSRFDSYAWGVTLVVLFVVVLFVLRLATNRLVPANLDLPRWANLALGFPVGLASGVLTLGITMIGLGFVQSQPSFAGFEGFRRAGGGRIQEVNVLWPPVHRLTSDFYGMLSVGAFSTSTPLRQYQPQLDRQAASQLRDSYREGRGQVVMRPNQASVVEAVVCPDLCVVKIRFERGARDYNEQLTLSCAQVRLVAAAAGSDRPLVAHPLRWAQEVKDEGEKVFNFDATAFYVTTIPGRESADVRFDFPWREGIRPLFVQIKGARLYIRQVQSLADCDQVIQGGGDTAADLSAAQPPAAGAGVLRPDVDIAVSISINPVRASTNTLPGTISHKDRYLTEGHALFSRAQQSYSHDQAIKGIQEPQGTRVVQLEVGRTSPADISGSVRAEAGDGAAPVLVDSRKNTYSAMGYIFESPDGTEIALEPGKGLVLRDIPQPPSAGKQRLRLIFLVTEGATVVGFRVGSVDVASCNFQVPAK